MPTIVHEKHIKIVRLSIALDQFPAHLSRHCISDPTTPEIERLGAKYVTETFPLKQTEGFVKAVCKWGNYAGVSGNVLKHNTLTSIQSCFRNAYSAQLKNDPREAIKLVTSLKGFAVSFGSKHLKFLDPERAVVLDSIISERLGYLRTPDGYAEFLGDCMSIRDALNTEGIAASKKQRLWRVSDVEMAIFSKLRS